MNKSLSVVICGLVVTGSAWAYQKGVVRSHYTDEAIGYALDTPKFPGLGETPGGTVVFTAPPEAGFASNVNVVVQPMTTTRKAYRDLTDGGIKKLSMKINEDKDATVSERDAIRFDYEGKMNGKDLHFLSLAVIEKDRVILFTCTATAVAFPKVASEFRACLDSVRLRPEIRP